MARPTKLTEALQAQIITDIRAGAPFKAAAMNAGITERTFHNWKSRGSRAKSGPFFQFLQLANKAESECVTFAAKVVFAHVRRGDLGAAKYYLDRRSPEYKQQVAASADPDDPPPKDREVVQVDLNDLAQAFRILEEAGEIRLDDIPAENAEAH